MDQESSFWLQGSLSRLGKAELKDYSGLVSAAFVGGAVEIAWRK